MCPLFESAAPACHIQRLSLNLITANLPPPLSGLILCVRVLIESTVSLELASLPTIWLYPLGREVYGGQGVGGGPLARPGSPA